jgi:citrate lyase beta subunit
MTPGEISACYRLYAADRESHETFPGTIRATSNAGNLDDLAVLLRLQTGLEELVRDIGHRDPNDDLRPALTRSLGRWRKMLASFAAQLFGRGALVGR